MAELAQRSLLCRTAHAYNHWAFREGEGGICWASETHCMARKPVDREKNTGLLSMGLLARAVLTGTQMLPGTRGSADSKALAPDTGWRVGSPLFLPPVFSLGTWEKRNAAVFVLLFLASLT